MDSTEQLSQWHPKITPPERDGNYEIKFHDGHTQRWHFSVMTGWQNLPDPYVKEWRGIARLE